MALLAQPRTKTPNATNELSGTALRRRTDSSIRIYEPEESADTPPSHCPRIAYMNYLATFATEPQQWVAWEVRAKIMGMEREAGWAGPGTAGITDAACRSTFTRKKR